LLPPTLIASVYGMNFQFMPELQWSFGYGYAVLLMVASAVVPMWYFRKRGWLK
jgi:magnesium transporter